MMARAAFWCLMSLTCAALATPAFADESDGCSHFAWDVSHEVKVMNGTLAPVTAATASGAKVPVVKLDKVYEVKLAPQSSVNYSVKPAKPTLNDSAQGGLVSFHVSKAGLYRVSITSGHWIDIVDGDQLIKSKDFSGSRDCPRPHKVVEFELPANKDLVLQFSGSADASVIAAITPVPVAAPTN